MVKTTPEPKFTHISPAMLIDGVYLDKGEPKFRYFDPTTTQPAFYATFPYEFETATSRWSNMTFTFDPSNWIQMREGEEILKK